MRFAPLEALHFVEEQLKAGSAIAEVELEKPPGRKGHVLWIEAELIRRPWAALPLPLRRRWRRDQG